MKRFLKIILFLIGFPALLGFVVWKSLTVIQEGSTYGFWPYVGIILAGVFALVYLIAFIITGVKAKKNAGNRKKVMGGVVALVIVSFVMTAGLWLVIDIPKLLPDILNSATSGTIGFDDLRENYSAQSEVHGNLLDEFIKLNYQNENLDNSYTLDSWLEAGYSSPEVQDLIATNFASMDKNGYVTFKGPWINLADGGRLTIPVLVHLIINEREFQDLPYILKYDLIPNPYKDDDFNDKFQNEGYYPEHDQEYLVKWSILDMQGTPMEIDLGGILSDDIKSLILGVTSLMPEAIVSVLNTLNECIADDALAGTPIYIGIDAQNGDFKLVISSTVESRGMWDYKKSAWLNSNHLLFAVISVFPARQWLYIWGGIVVFTSVAIGALRLKEFGGEEEEEGEGEQKKAAYVPAKVDYSEIDKEVTKGMSPYERSFYYATQERLRR